MADTTITKLKQNMDAVDDLVNSNVATVTTPDGRVDKTFSEIQRQANEILANLGLEYPPIAYTSGLTVERNTQTYRYNDVIYINSRSDLPFTTTGAFDEGGWQVVQQINQSTVIFSADGIKGLDAVALIDRASYSVSGFYAGTEVGGGAFVYDASRDKADHNGGTVITPEAIAAWDGTQGNLGTLLDWTGTGTGAFVLLIDDNEVSLLNFGATGVATDNQSICFDAAFKTHNQYGYTITGRKQDTYLIDSDVVTKNIGWDGKGCLIKVASTVDTAIRASLGWTKTGVSTDNNLVLQTSMASDFTTGGIDDNQVELSSVSGIEKGHIISIVTNDAFGPSRFFVYKRGITSIVQKVDAVNNIVYLENTIPYNLTAASSRVVVFIPNEVVFLNTKFIGNAVEDDQSGLTVDGAINPILENLEFDIFGEASLSCRHCIDVSAKNVKTRRSYWEDTQQTSYGLTVNSCNGVYIDNLNAFTGRHGFSTGANSFGLPIDTTSDTRGNPCMNITIDDSKIYPELGTTILSGGSSNGLDCHGGTKDITINNSEVYRYQIEADKVVFNDCKIRGVANSSCFIGARPLTNGFTSWEFNNCELDAHRIAIRGVEIANFTDPVGITSITFKNCGLSSGQVTINLEAEVGSLTANSIINNLTIDNSEKVVINAHDTANLRIEHLNFLNIKDGHDRAYNLPNAPFGAVGNLYHSNVYIQPSFSAIHAQMAETVRIDSIKWAPDTDTSTFRARFSDASEVYITNTKLNFGTTQFNSVQIIEDAATHGGGTWYSINSPVLIDGGVALTSFGFTSVTEL